MMLRFLYSDFVFIKEQSTEETVSVSPQKRFYINWCHGRIVRFIGRLGIVYTQIKDQDTDNFLQPVSESDPIRDLIFSSRTV